MSAKNRTLEFIDYITRHKSAFEYGYMTYKQLYDDAYYAETHSGDTTKMTPQLADAYNKFWEKYSDLNDSDYPARSKTRTHRLNKALDLN